MLSKKLIKNRAFDLSILEARLMYCADDGLDDDFGTYPGIDGPSLVMGSTSTTTGAVGSVGVAGGVPGYSSNPGATVKLYIDFNGAAATSWGSYSVPTTPAYDQDGDASTFSDAELASIKEIWARVSEKYSPFNIDVTTVDPGSYPIGKVLRVVVGGNGSWAGGGYGGISYVNAFTSGPNTSWVFPANLGNGTPLYTAEAVSHESGHAFGLQHQSTWSGTTKTAEYSMGNATTAPIMGNSYYATRGTWWYGTSSISSTSIQDDMAIISRSANGFGYRADDHGNSLSVADTLLVSGDTLSGSGVIEKTTDSDYFKFMTAGGAVTLSANVIAAGATLDLKLALYDANGGLVGTADTASLGESISLTLSPGTYYLSVISEGNYGDVGQYTITGTAAAPAGVLGAPTGLTATSTSTAVTLGWADTSTGESGFVVQRSNDGGVTWLDVATVGANATSYQDAPLSAGTSVEYRVYAFNATTVSDFSNDVTVMSVPTTPVNVAAKAMSSTQVSVTWTLVNGASDYVIQRSTDGVNWVQLANVSCCGGAFSDVGVSSNTIYYYRVAASNWGGTSSFSAAAEAVTPKLALPIAPSSLVATRVGKGKIGLKWVDNSTNETGFRIEYSSDGVKWSLLTTVGANATTYTASGLRKGRTYSFRICASNAAGNSAYCNVSSATAAAKAGAQVIATTPTGAAAFSQSRVTTLSLESDDPTKLKTKTSKVF
jgi:hypothetical protein